MLRGKLAEQKRDRYKREELTNEKKSIAGLVFCILGIIWIFMFADARNLKTITAIPVILAGIIYIALIYRSNNKCG